MAGKGGRRPGAGRPLGSKNKLPTGRKNYDEFKKMVYDAELSEYLITNDSKEFAGNALQLMVAIYKAEQLPVKTRLYAAAKACEFEPRIIEQPETEESRKEREREWHELLDYFAKHAINETIYRLSGQKPGKSGCPAWIIPLVTEQLAKCGALLETRPSEIKPPEQPAVVVRKRKPVTVNEGICGNDVEEPKKARETAGAIRCPAGQNHAMMDNLREQAGTTASYRSEAQAPAKPPEALPLPFGEPQHQLATVILHARPHQCFQALSGNRYSADERGEIRCNDRDDIESLLRSGCKAPAS
jgi:hypothetical protein